VVDEVAVLGAHVVRSAGAVTRAEAVATVVGIAVTGTSGTVADLTAVVSIRTGDRAAGDVRVATGGAGRVVAGIAFAADAGLTAAVNGPHGSVARAGLRTAVAERGSGDPAGGVAAVMRRLRCRARGTAGVVS
jgi:hypothetical protein